MSSTSPEMSQQPALACLQATGPVEPSSRPSRKGQRGTSYNKGVFSAFKRQLECYVLPVRKEAFVESQPAVARYTHEVSAEEIIVWHQRETPSVEKCNRTTRQDVCQPTSRPMAVELSSRLRFHQRDDLDELLRRTARDSQSVAPMVAELHSYHVGGGRRSSMEDSQRTVGQLMVYDRHPKRPTVCQPPALSERRYDHHIRHAMKYRRVDKATVISGSTDFSKVAFHEAHTDVHWVNKKLTWIPLFEANLLPCVEQNNERLSHVTEASISFQNIVIGPMCSTLPKSKPLEYFLHSDGPLAPLSLESKLFGLEQLNGGLAHIKIMKALNNH